MNQEDSSIKRLRDILLKFFERFQQSTISNTDKEKKISLTQAGSRGGIYITYNVESELFYVEHYYKNEDGGEPVEVILEKINNSYLVPNALSLHLSYNKAPLSFDEIIEQFDILCERFNDYIRRVEEMYKATV